MTGNGHEDAPIAAPGGARIADDAIYLGEDRFAQPKETFRMVADAISADGHRPDAALLDIGCATGEFLHYVGTRFPGLARVGIDVSEAMIAEARRRVPEAIFAVGSADDDALFKTDAYDIVTLQGVLSIFDDPAPVLTNALRTLRDGGVFYGLIIANEDPIDVIIRYRRVPADDHENMQPASGNRAKFNHPVPWESGWNVFSKRTIERYLSRNPRCSAWRWAPFRMPFALAKGDDPMRCWTIATEDNAHQRVNGACQLVNSFLLTVHVDTPDANRNPERDT